ncbi:MAG: dienelactone hydrolase family protein [Polyangiaceae bacterium]
MRTRPAACLFLASFFFLGGCDGPSSPARTDVGSPPAQPPSPGSTAQSAAVSTAEVDVGPGRIDGVEVYTGGAKAGDKVPLVIAIHGLGDRPEAFRGLFEGFATPAHFWIPAGGLPWGEGYSWWPIVGKIDENNIVPGLTAATDRLANAIQSWDRSAVRGTPIVTGFSQGGMLSFALAARHPALIEEAIPISGLEPPSFIPSAWPADGPRIFALHGEADQRVPFALAASGVEKLRAAGATVTWKTYPGVGHTISAEMRRDLFAELTAAIERATASH